jgi:cephalosporin hydroxylase
MIVSMAPVVDKFAQLYVESNVWGKTLWLGTPAYKCPLDLWMYQEILYRSRPDVIIETGTAAGGSALFLASICDLIGNGRIVTIDIKDEAEVRKHLGSIKVRCLPEHPRITYVRGSSVDPEVVARVRGALSADDRAMLILDSDHSKEHVLAELRAYAPAVSEDCYVIVEDTIADQAAPGFGGPGEAVEEFLAENPAFVVDKSCEKFLMTFNPGGYLRRQSDRRDEAGNRDRSRRIAESGVGEHLKRRPTADLESGAKSFDGSGAVGGRSAAEPPTGG